MQMNKSLSTDNYKGITASMILDAMPRPDIEGYRRRRAIRKKRDRQTIIDLIWLMIIIGLIIAGGRLARGYWAAGPEIITLLPGIVIILLRRREWR